MALYIGKEKFGSHEATPVKNQDKTITKSGTYTADEGYSGLGTVKAEFVGLPREVTADGTYREIPYSSTYTFALPEGATKLGPSALRYAFYGSGLQHFDLGSVTIADGNSLWYAFYDSSLRTANLSSLKTAQGPLVLNSTFARCSQLTSVNLDNLETASGNQVCYGAFASCTSLTTLAFPKLRRVDGNRACFTLCQSCTNLESIDLSGLEQIGDATDAAKNCSHFYQAFTSTKITELRFPKLESIYCTGSSSEGTFASNETIEKMYFPKLKTITYSPAYQGTSTSYTDGCNNVFRYCSKLTEIHFGAENEEAIKATSGYATLWGRGAGNATVYFDL